MNAQEAASYIKEHAVPTRQMVAGAKSYMVRHYQSDVLALIEGYLASVGASLPQGHIILHPSVDPMPAVQQVAHYFAHRLAAWEAVWALVHSDVFLPSTDRVSQLSVHVPWATAPEGQSRTMVRWTSNDFPEFQCVVPTTVAAGSLLRSGHAQPLADGDLFLSELGIPDLHPSIAEALREAVRCFRHELFTPCLVMLAKAGEGAWTLLGLAVSDALQGNEPNNAEKLRTALGDSYYSFARRVTDIAEIYRTKAALAAARARVRSSEVDEASVWTHQVRDARNLVHFDYESALPNSYDKVAALLIGAVRYLRILDSAKKAAAAGE